GLDLDADADVPGGRKEMIDDVEPLLARRPVDRRDVGDVDETAALVVAQEGRDPDDVGGVGGEGQLAPLDLMAGDRARERARDGLSQLLQRLVHAGSAHTLQSTMNSRAPRSVCERCAPSSSATW